MPYLEEQAIFDQLRPADEWILPVDTNRTGKRNLADVLSAAKAGKTAELVPLQTPITVFRCPSDSTPPLIPVIGKGDVDPAVTRTTDTGTWERHFYGMYAPIGFQPSTSNYVASMGTIDAICDGGLLGGQWVIDQPRCNNTGVFFGNSAISMKQITDGTSKTFAVGERDKFCLAATWIGVRNPYGPEMWSSRLGTGPYVFQAELSVDGKPRHVYGIVQQRASWRRDFLLFATDPCISSATILILTISTMRQDCFYTPPSSSKPCHVQEHCRHLRLESINDWPGGTMGLRSMAVPIESRFGDYYDWMTR